jgi:hypothetical protein
MAFRSPKDEDLVSHIIDIYRELISQRYQYEILKNYGILPQHIDKEIVDNIRNYFLNDVYPESKKRLQIEQAFETLGNYTKQPTKVFGLFGSVATSVIIFGRHLPKAINAGIITLQSFIDARQLEHQIIYASKRKYKDKLITTDEMKMCIVEVPKADIEKFVNDIREMFLLMSNTELLSKTIKIIDLVIDKMKSKPNIYPQNEVNGIILGRNILKNGYQLFNKYPESIKNEIANTIYNVEMSFINDLYSRYKT